MSDVIEEIDPNFGIVISAIANLIGTRFAFDPDLTEADIDDAMNDLRDLVVTIFRYRRENDVSNGELIRHDN